MVWLGRTEMAKDLPQRATWMATGNNLHVGGDLARRCYWIRLDAGMAPSPRPSWAKWPWAEAPSQAASPLRSV